MKSKITQRKHHFHSNGWKNINANTNVFLKSIAYYLVDEGTWWRETTEDVEFCDIGEAPENTSMIVSHFRSTTIKQQLTHVSNCWAQAMMEKNTKIPAQSIENINTENRELLTTLKCFSDISTPLDVLPL